MLNVLKVSLKLGFSSLTLILCLGSMQAHADDPPQGMPVNCQMPQLPPGCSFDNCQMTCTTPGHTTSANVSFYPTAPGSTNNIDTGGWLYDSYPSSDAFGEIGVSCSHPDLRGIPWNQL